MRAMSKFFCAWIILLSAIPLSAQQDKRVYITLDVSSSMSGDKYVLANYTTQMIVTLCDNNDEVYMIVYGKDACLSKNNNPLSVIQKPMRNLKFGLPRSSDSQFDDIIGFNNIYKPSDSREDWLFVIGDGQWGTENNKYKHDRERFSKIVEQGTLNVCYLQTGHSLSEENDFTQFANTFGVIDIRKSDTNTPTVKEGCDYFARKILGFSEVPLKVKKQGNRQISILSEMPLKGFYMVYQDEVIPERLPNVESVTIGSNSLQAKLKGIPTTIPLKSSKGEVNLSGAVYLTEGNIPAQAEIAMLFDKEVKPENISIYPIVKDVEFDSGSFTVKGNSLKRLDSHTLTICRDETKAQVRIELSGASKENLTEGLLQKTKVVVKANNKDYPAHYNNGGFECEVDLIEDETPYYAECDCPGYFKRVTPITKIVKGDCPPEKPEKLEVQERPVADLGSLTFEQLRKDDITFTINDSLTNEALNPNLFDITFEVDNDFMYEEPKVRIENGVIHLELRPKGEWCECLFPEGLDIRMISTPKDEAFQEYGKNYHQTVFPFHAEVIKDHPWLSRCMWVIITLIILLLLFFYLRALQRKYRFKKNATITPFYYDYYSNRIEAGCMYLRKEGFGSWFARWFLPGDERNTLSFDKPNTTIRFVAAESNDVVNIPKDGNIDPETMRISGYNPNRDQFPKEPVKLGNNGKVNILKSDGNDDGYLVFTSGEHTDGHLFRIIVALLIAADVVGFLFLVYLLIRSFF